MSLLWIDGFDSFSAIGDLSTEYSVSANLPTFNTTGGVVNNGGNVRFNATFRSINRAVSSTLTAGGMIHYGIWVKITTYHSFNAQLLAISTNLQSSEAGGGGDNSSAASLWMDNAGTLQVNKHGAATMIGTSAVGALTTGTYHFVEYAAKLNTFANGGFVKVWVDGNIVINSTTTSQDAVSGTVPTTWTNLKIASSASGLSRDLVYDDVMIWDEVGTDFALTQISSAYLPFIETLRPDGDDAVQFTRSTGATNASCVDESGLHNGDTDYNQSNTVGHVDLLTYANPSTTPAYVFAIGVSTEAKIDIAGTINFRTRMKSGATTTNSADRLLGLSYTRYHDFFGKDPDTTAVWAVTAPAAIKAGYDYHS